MKVNYNQFLAVVYADIFDWPLREAEINQCKIQDTRHGIRDRKIEVGERDGYWFLPGRESLIKQRIKKEKISVKKKIIAEVVVRFLAKIPTIEAIFLTGSVAVGSARKDGDIDLMIITTPNCLWLTRVIVALLLKTFGVYGNSPDRICPNIFLDSNHLKIEERNLYTAHEVLQAKCLFDRGGIQKKWIVRNGWTKNFLPKAYAYKVPRITYHAHKRCSFAKYMVHNTLYMLPELVAFVLEYLYQKPRQSSERLGWGYAFFHPDQMAKKIEDKFGQRLIKYNN